jgi:hypothetical protein
MLRAEAVGVILRCILIILCRYAVSGVAVVSASASAAPPASSSPAPAARPRCVSALARCRMPLRYRTPRDCSPSVTCVPSGLSTKFLCLKLRLPSKRRATAMPAAVRPRKHPCIQCSPFAVLHRMLCSIRAVFMHTYDVSQFIDVRRWRRCTSRMPGNAQNAGGARVNLATAGRVRIPP